MPHFFFFWVSWLHEAIALCNSGCIGIIADAHHLHRIFPSCRVWGESICTHLQSSGMHIPSLKFAHSLRIALLTALAKSLFIIVFSYWRGSWASSQIFKARSFSSLGLALHLRKSFRRWYFHPTCSAIKVSRIPLFSVQFLICFRSSFLSKVVIMF